MGYRTEYNLGVTPYDIHIVEELEKRDTFLIQALNYGATCKWYDHEEEMLEISKEFPNTLFELSGKGEEAGDLWRKYFKNGKVQRCPATITFAPYDEDELREVGE